MKEYRIEDPASQALGDFKLLCASKISTCQSSVNFTNNLKHNITIMPNYLVVLILSVFVLLGAFYENTVERRIIQIKEELLEHENEKNESKRRIKIDQ